MGRTAVLELRCVYGMMGVAESRGRMGRGLPERVVRNARRSCGDGVYILGSVDLVLGFVRCVSVGG